MPAHSLPLCPLLPPEIIDYIYGYLWDFPDDLRTCAIISRACHAVVRPYIFRRLTLYNNERLKELEDIIENEPYIGCWVRELVIKPDPYLLLQCSIWHPIINPSAWIFRLHTILSSKLKRLYSVQLVGLGETGWKYRELATFIPKFAYFTSIKSISFIDCRLPRDVIRSVISVFAQLEELRIENTTDLPDARWTSGVKLPCIHCPSVSRLSVRAPDGEDSWEANSFLKWIDPKKQLSNLNFLEVLLQHPGNIMDFGVLLESLGPSLQELVVDISADFWDMEQQALAIIECCDFSKITGLRKVQLSPVTHPGVPHLISLLPPATIEIIKFGASSSQLREFDLIDLAVVDDWMDLSLFKALKEVRFLCSGDLDVEEALQNLTVVLPKLAMKDLVRVSQVE